MVVVAWATAGGDEPSARLGRDVNGVDAEAGVAGSTATDVRIVG
jgi:hypothetical protein